LSVELRFFLINSSQIFIAAHLCQINIYKLFISPNMRLIKMMNAKRFSSKIN